MYCDFWLQSLSEPATSCCSSRPWLVPRAPWETIFPWSMGRFHRQWPSFYSPAEASLAPSWPQSRGARLLSLRACNVFAGAGRGWAAVALLLSPGRSILMRSSISSRGESIPGEMRALALVGPIIHYSDCFHFPTHSLSPELSSPFQLIFHSLVFNIQLENTYITLQFQNFRIPWKACSNVWLLPMSLLIY